MKGGGHYRSWAFNNIRRATYALPAFECPVYSLFEEHRVVTHNITQRKHVMKAPISYLASSRKVRTRCPRSFRWPGPGYGDGHYSSGGKCEDVNVIVTSSKGSSEHSPLY